VFDYLHFERDVNGVFVAQYWRTQIWIHLAQVIQIDGDDRKVKTQSGIDFPSYEPTMSFSLLSDKNYYLSGGREPLS